jgi:CBS domain-containing protein
MRLRDTDELAIPLVDEGRFVGLVAVSEIASSLAQSSDSDLKIDELSRAPSVILSSSDTLEKAAISMADPRTPLLPVNDPKTGIFSGIVTRRDVLDAYRNAANASLLPV